MSEVQESLKERVLSYQRTGEGLERIIQDLSESIYLYPLRGRRGREDDAGEFYLYFVPRLKRLLLKYEDQGVPFEHYFNATLYWNLRSYFRSMRKRRWRWKMSACPEFWDLSTRDSAADSSDGSLSAVDWKVILSEMGEGITNDDTNRKRFLFLFLRHVRDIDEPEIELFSQRTGYDRWWLQERVMHLRESLQIREDRLAYLQRKRNQAYARCLLLEKERSEEMDREIRDGLTLKIGKMRRLMRKTMYEISRVPLSPSHAVIARELGVPKGTVDTGLFWINKMLKTLYSDRMIEYA